MKKNEFIAKVNAYNEYAKSVDCHVKPEKGSVNGAYGRSYEMTVKLYLGNYKTLVAGAGKADTTKKGLKIEISQILRIYRHQNRGYDCRCKCNQHDHMGFHKRHEFSCEQVPYCPSAVDISHPGISAGRMTMCCHMCYLPRRQN